MRDQGQMVALLEEMAADEHGQTWAARTLSDEHAVRDRHIDLLLGEGYVVWTTDKRSMVRITGAGYDFLDSVKKGRVLRFFVWLGKKLPFAAVVSSALAGVWKALS